MGENISPIYASSTYFLRSVILATDSLMLIFSHTRYDMSQSVASIRTGNINLTSRYTARTEVWLCNNCSSMISWIQSSRHHRQWHWSWRFSWITPLTTRTVHETEECHGGSNFERLKETAVMKSSTPFPSTSTGFFLHRKVSIVNSPW